MLGAGAVGAQTRPNHRRSHAHVEEAPGRTRPRQAADELNTTPTALSAGLVRLCLSLSCAMAEPRLAFKAGRAFRREGTNWVDPNPTKGAIVLQNGEDGLLHFIWKNRSTNESEEVSAFTSA